MFGATHKLLETLLQQGTIDAVRIDHPDGLFDPARYFEMLQELAVHAWHVEPSKAGEPPRRPLYSCRREDRLRPGSAPAPLGRSRHDGLQLSQRSQRPLREQCARPTHAPHIRKLTGRLEPFEDVVYASNRLIMETGMASELNVLAHMLNRIGKGNRRSRDFTLESLRDVITEVVACFPVYRTYVDERGWTAEDRAIVEQAIARARRRNPAMESSLFDFFREGGTGEGRRRSAETRQSS